MKKKRAPRKRQLDPSVIGSAVLGALSGQIAKEAFSTRGRPKQGQIRIRKRKLDPKAKLPKPIDLRGYDHSLIRVVPEIDRLMEVQLVVPSHIWNDLRKVTEGWSDVEVDEENGRIVRRGRRNQATNLFIDKK